MIRKISLLIVVCFISMFTADYVMSYSAAPPAMRTNAPKEGTCTGCHAGTLNAGKGSISISFPDTIYKPDSTYTLTATVTDGNMQRFGFQLTSLDANDSMMGSFIITNATNTAAQMGTVAGKTRNYISHKTANSTSTWSFDWKAPSAGMGTVSFYLAGNATNGSQTAMGDNVYADDFTWDEYNAPVITPVEITGTESICEDATASFTATAGFQSYIWSTGDTTSSALYVGNSSGTKTIWVIADSGLSTEVRDSVDLIVHPTPNGPIIMDSSFLNTIYITNVAPGSTYQWYKGNSKLTDSTRTMLEYTESGDYHVEVTDSNGCTNTSNTVTTQFSTSVSASVSADIKLFPNPSNGSIQLSNAVGSKVEVININGQLVQSIANVATNSLKLELETGMYFVKVSNENQSSIEKVLIR